MQNVHEANQFLKVRSANEHNLKNVDINIPKNKLIVMTGVSGSGKSSLAFDTIYAEGQRRYVESLSAYECDWVMLNHKRTWEHNLNSPILAKRDLEYNILKRFLAFW